MGSVLTHCPYSWLVEQGFVLVTELVPRQPMVNTELVLSQLLPGHESPAIVPYNASL